MHLSRILFCLVLVLAGFSSHAQIQTLAYELNGRNPDDVSQNPFGKFVGEWTLKDDNWTHNWGGETETIKIPGHHTVSTPLNTDHTLLSIIDGPEPNGHIVWTYNPNSQEVHHQSSFGTIRIGTGKGKVYPNGNVELKLVFEGEAKETYRIYRYRWISDDEYHMKSVQYNAKDEPTGLFYEGNFVRIQPQKTLQEEIKGILAVLDDNSLPKEEQVYVYAEDVVHMAPGSDVIEGKEELLAYLNQQKAYGHSEMEHQIVEFSEKGEVVIMRGKVEGLFHPADGGKAIAFQTKNLFVFRREKGALKIAKVIYNMSPTH